MASEFQSRVAEAVLRVMQPLARTVLRFGVSWRECDQLARRAFVEAASSEYGIRGRLTNVSRVAAMTGLSRKEIRRIRNLAPGDFPEPLSRRNRAAELLHHWHTDREYLTADGQPIPLPYAGAGPSFASLVRRTGGDLSISVMRAELLRAGAMAAMPDGRLRAVKRDFIPAEVDSRLIEGLQFGLRGLLDTVLVNATAERRGEPRFQREVHCDNVPVSQVAEVRRGLREILTRASERLDNQLSSVEKEPHPAGREARFKRVSVGLYYFERAPRVMPDPGRSCGGGQKPE